MNLYELFAADIIGLSFFFGGRWLLRRFFP